MLMEINEEELKDSYDVINLGIEYEDAQCFEIIPKFKTVLLMYS